MIEGRTLQDAEATAVAALSHWNLPVQKPELVQHRENTVFSVRDTHGTRFALRIHRAGYHSAAALRSELLWMSELSRAGLEVPGPLPARDGQLSAEVTPGSIVDLLTWLDGEPLGTTGKPFERSGDEITQTFEAVGRQMAELHNISDQWQRPDDFSRHAWDAEGLVGGEPFWGRFWEHEDLTAEQSSLLVAARDLLRKEFRRHGKELDYGLIHADLVRENILVSGDTVRFIDFDDAGFGWRLFDIATALIKNRAEPDYPALKAALIAGYRRNRPLSDNDLAQLPMFELARSLTYLGWARQRRGEPGLDRRVPRMIAQAVELAEMSV